MENISINHIILYQDSAKVNSKTISIEIPTENQVKVDAPQTVAEIPAVPKRFQKTQKTNQPSKKIFIPSVEDSIAFNLKTRVRQEQGILSNTVVRDFLDPMPQSNKLWVMPGVRRDSVTYQVSVTESKLADEDVTTDNTVSVSQADSLKPLAIADTIMQEHDVVSGERIDQKELVTETAVRETEHQFFREKGYAKDVLTGLLILSVTIAGVIRLANYRYMRELFSSVIFSQFARKMIKSESLRNQKAAFALSGLFLFNTSLFIYEYVSYHQVSTILNKGLLLIPLAMAVIFGFGLVKGLLYRLVAYVFDCKSETSEYIFYMRLHDKIFGLVMIPVILVIPYIDVSGLPALFNFGIGIYVLLYLVQLFRGFAIILKNVASLFYMFLYLCALEILPLIIMYNILID
ncbi:DUF4271 domain-containing protein [Saccharicrinis fermentans]|uniref:DUF4271 domain-containing protein n=1 Tax=Saccharicrinis fermentans DSM 9555 = JCM 21142 TaxID=869213 RepID=W7YSE5_9BACT|nr:DUF4271 domain-containing protein [Saccharicrinis fermentans]GAF05384.1 hypothetical protein JCM21142_104116 [Saccharicrinis fermentans DSM 9555 = JCM 21142]